MFQKKSLNTKGAPRNINEKSVEDNVILDNVCRILEDGNQSLNARELVKKLDGIGICLSRESLNRILYNPKKQRAGLVFDKNWKWTYSRPQINDKKNPDGEVEYKINAIISLCEELGLTFEGIRRKKSDQLFLILGETEAGYRIVGPKGLILHENSASFRDPEECSLISFTDEQINTAISETFKEFSSEKKKHNTAFLNCLEETEFFYEKVYHGPLYERVTDSIPVKAFMAVAVVHELNPCELRFGPRLVFEPFYLVVDALFGAWREERYGVFKLNVYDLIKKAIIRVDKDQILFKLSSHKDGIYLEGPTSKLKLE